MRFLARPIRVGALCVGLCCFGCTDDDSIVECITSQDCAEGCPEGTVPQCILGMCECDGTGTGGTGGGVGGTSGTGGGAGGTAGSGGTAGDGGSGGSGAMTGVCGFGNECSFEDDALAWCAANVCGSEENTFLGACEPGDFNYYCECNSGACSQDNCVEPPACSLDDPNARMLCEMEAYEICGSEDNVRTDSATCVNYAGGPGCFWICKYSGNPPCE